MKNGNLYEGMVHHSLYQYEKCEICNYSTRTFSLCDFDEPSSAPISSMIADKVSVEIFPLRKVKVSNDM